MDLTDNRAHPVLTEYQAIKVDKFLLIYIHSNMLNVLYPGYSGLDGTYGRDGSMEAMVT